MRNLLSIVLILFVFLQVQAQDDSSIGQTDQGSWLIEANTGDALLGNTAIYFTSFDGDSMYNFGLDGGYFIMDDLAIKAGLGYGGGDDIDGVFSYRLGVKYYAIDVIPVTIDLTGASIEDADENPLWFGIGAGYAWFISDDISIEPGVRYNLSLNEDFTDEGLLQFNIGFALYF